MEVEALASNLFFKQLVSRYKDLWVSAASKKMSVCVPQSCSLRSPTLSREDVESHILIPMWSEEGQFRTQNGKQLTIVGSSIHCGKGFDRRLVVQVISTQEVTCTDDPDHNEVSILFINRPLQGGIDAPSAVDDMDRTTVKRYIGLLKSCPENEIVFQQLGDFIKATKALAARKQLATVVPSLQKCVESHCDAAAGMLRSSTCFDRTTNDTARIQLQFLRQVLESYVMEQLHSDIMTWYQSQFAEQTEVLRTQLKAMALLPIADFHIRKVFQTDFHNAIVTLQELPKLTTPLDKLQCLRRVSTAVHDAVERNLEVQGLDPGDVDLSTDDLVDILIYVVVHARPVSDDLLIHLKYAQRFHFVNSNTSILGFMLANFEVVVSWLISKPQTQTSESTLDAERSVGRTSTPSSIAVPSELVEELKDDERVLGLGTARSHSQTIRRPVSHAAAASQMSSLQVPLLEATGTGGTTPTTA